MSCIITYKGKKYSEEQFLQYLNKQIAINNLFNENESLANSVYEALGFLYSPLTNEDKTKIDNKAKEELAIFNRLLALTKKNNFNEAYDVLVDRIIEAGKDINRREEYIELGKFQEHINTYFGYLINDKNDKTAKDTKITDVINEIKEQAEKDKTKRKRNKITTQQKQRAQLAYFQYLDSLNKPNTNPVLNNNQQEQVKKFIELQERLNNKEFLEGAKNAYESTSDLQQFGTQEEYNDYIARVSLGIIKNPSSGDYNYTSQVKDIVYHETSKYSKERILQKGFNAPIEELLELGKDSLIWFSHQKNYYRTKNTVSIPAILNSISPKVDSHQNFERVGDASGIKKYNLEAVGADAIITEEYADEDLPPLRDLPEDFVNPIVFAAVIEPDQIHILGSNQDIQGFKNFVQGKQFQKLTAEEIAKEQNNSLFGLNTQNQEQLEFHVNTLNVVSKFLENVGVEQRLVPEFLSQDGTIVDRALAAANFIEGTVDIIDDLNKGRAEAWNKLPEEAAHWWYRLLNENSPLKKALWESHQTALKNDELYKTQYGELVKSPSDLTEESIGQLIAEAIKRIETKNGNASDYSFFKKFLEWINSIIDTFKNTTQDPFEVAAIKILSSDMSDLMTWEEYRKLNNIVNFADVVTEQSVAPLDYTIIEDLVDYKTDWVEYGENIVPEYTLYVKGDVYNYENVILDTIKFNTKEELDNYVYQQFGKEYDKRQKQILQEVRDNQIFFDRLLNKTFRKKSKFLPKTLRKYFDIIDAQKINPLREWNISQELLQITKKLTPEEKRQIIETNGYTNIAPTLKVLPDLLQKYRKNPIVLSETIKVDGAKKQELSILNGIKEMISLENPNLKSITAEEFVNEAHNWLQTNYLLGFANEKSYLSYRTDQTFSYLSDRQSNEDVDITNMTEEELRRLPLEERQRIANIIGLTKQNPDVYHNKVSLRFNDSYHTDYGQDANHFAKRPSAWGNLTYFYTGKNKWKDAVLLHEIQNDNIEALRNFKTEKVDLETSLGRYLQQLYADLVDNITQIESGGKKIIKRDSSEDFSKTHFQLNFQLLQLKDLPLEQGLLQLKQNLNERIELYKSDPSKNSEKAQEAVEEAYSKRRIFQDFQKRGGIKSLLTKEELQDLEDILKRLNTEEVEGRAQWLPDENRVEPGFPSIRNLNRKKQDFKFKTIELQARITRELQKMYGDNAPLIILTPPAKPLPKSQRNIRTVGYGQNQRRIGGASQELNENVNWLLAYSEKKILENLSKAIEESKKNYIIARNATVANNFNIQLSKITLEQWANLVENYTYNEDLLKRLIDEQAQKDVKKAYTEVNPEDNPLISSQFYETINGLPLNTKEVKNEVHFGTWEFGYADIYYDEIYYYAELDNGKWAKIKKSDLKDAIIKSNAKDARKKVQETKFETLKQQALDKKAELEKNYGKIEEEVQQALEIEMNYFTPLVHHLIQKHINQCGKDFPMYFSGYQITKLTQGNDRTAWIYAGKDEVSFTKEESDFIKYKAAQQIGLVEKNEFDELLKRNNTDESSLSNKDKEIIQNGIKKLNDYKKQSKQNLDRVINTIMNISSNRPIETGAIYNAMSQISGVKLIWQDKIEGLQGNVGGYLVDLTNYNYNTPILYGLGTSKVVPINPNMVNNSEIQYSKVVSKQDIEGVKTFINERNSIDLNQSKDLQSISDNINNLNITDATIQPLVGNSVITSNVTLISVKQQLEFVDYLTNKIASDLILQLKDNSKLKFSSDYLRGQLNTYKNIFEQASALIRTTTLKKQHIQEYLNNWENVEQAVLNRLKLISGLRLKQNESLLEEDLADNNDEFSTEESLIVKSNYDDGFFLTLDYNNIASTEMRLALYGLTNKNKNFYLTPNDPTSALPIGIETVLNTVHSITADLPGDYNKMKEAMVANLKKYPWLGDLMNRLDNNETLKNQFVRNMHKYTVNMKKIIDKGNGEYSLFNSNSNSVYFVNLQEWNDLFLESKLVRENKEGRYEFNSNSIKGFANFLGIKITPNRIVIQSDGLLNKIVNDKTITTNEKKDFLDKFLAYFNIYLTNDLIEDIINDRYSVTTTSSTPSTFGSLFTGNNSLFGKLLYNVLEGKELDTLYSGNLMKNLIVQNSEIASSSFWSGNKTISGYSYPMYLTEETNALFEKDNNGELVNVKALSILPFSQNNYLIEGLLSGHRAYLESFEYFHLDLSPIEIKGSKDRFSEFQNLSPISQYKIRLTNFWNNGTTIDGQRVALMFYPTMSDKKVPVLFTIPVRDIPSSPIQLANMLYDSLVSPEISRMKSWREALENSTEQGELIPNLEWFNEGANIFYRIPELNDLSVDFNGEELSLLIDFPETLTDSNGIPLKKKLDNADKGLSTRIKKIVNPALFEDGSDKQIILQQAIKNRITEVVDREINNQINQWKSDGLTIKDIPVEYLQYTNKKYEITSQDVEGQWYNLAKDFVLNGMMVNANLEALYISDTADYFDKSAYKEISKENINWTSVIKKTEANRAKRLSGDKAIRYYGDYTVKPTVNVLYAQDVKALPAALDYYKKLGFSDSFIDDNLKANTTDGFILCSIDEHLENLVLAGTISNKERTSILKQYYSGKSLSVDTLNIILNPLKPVFNGKQLVSNAPWKEHKIFIKYAQVPLLRQFTEGGNLYLDKLRKLVEDSQQNTDRSKQIDIIAFASTTKVGLPLKGNQVNVLNNSLYQTKDYESNIIPLNRRNFGIQLDKPFDEFKHKITIGTQETSTLFSRIRNTKGFNYKGKIYTGRELEKVYENVYKNIYQRQYNKLVDELFNEDKTQIDINKLGDLIYKEGVARGYSINTLLGLNINKDTNNFDVPLWANPESSKIEALLMAVIKNRVIKLKTTGKGFILQSDIGVWEDKTTEEKSDIVNTMIFTSQWDGNKLKGRHIDPETGEVLGAQILIRSVFEDSFGRTYDIYDYIDKIGTKTTSGRYIIDLNKLSQAIPKSILEGFGFRIPTQDYSSMSLVEIVGFLPKTHGDAIIAPSDFVSQMGLDFDIDVLYTYLYKTASVFDSELGIPVLKRLDELTESDINSIARTTIQAKKSNSLAESTLNLFDAALKQEDLKEKLKEEIEEAKLYNELLDIHIAVSKFVGEDGKDMSVQNMFSKLLDYGGLEDGSNKEVAAKFQEVRDTKLGLNTFNYLTPQHQGDSYNRANAAKGAVGAFATIKGLFNDIIDKFKEPLQFVSNKDGENTFYLKIDNFETTGHIAANVSKESPLDIINNFLSTTVDDEKLRVLPRLNINDYTIPTIVGLTGLGFNLNQILNIINQDVIFTAIKILKQKQATGNINSRDPFTIFNVLKEAGYFKDYESLEDLNIPYFDLTTEDLEKSRGVSEGELYKKVQAKALYVFLQGLKVGNQLFYIRSNTNMSSKGLPASIIDTTKLADNIKYLKEDKIGKSSEKIINTSQLYDGTLAGYLYNYAVLPSKNWFKDYYPYDSLVVNKILQTLAFNITGDPTNIKEALEEFPGLYERAFKHIKAYINSSKDVLGYTNLDTIRKNLITDNKKEITRTIKDSLTGLVNDVSDVYFASENGKLQLSLSTIISNLKKTPYYKNNLFLRALTVRTVKNIALISTNNTTGRKIDPNELFIEFSKLLTDNQNITFKVEAADESNNISMVNYTINSKELGIKLIQYSFLLNNTLKAKNFEKYIPTSLLKELGIFKGMQNFNWSNYTNVDNISTQIVQHNIDLVKSIISIENLKDVTSKISNENSLFTMVSTIKNGTKEMIYSFEPNIRNFFSEGILTSPYILIKQNKESYLYKYDASQNKYIFLPALGNQFLTEYNPNSTGNITSSIFNINNPDFNGDITTYKSTQDIILTQDKKDRRTNLSNALNELLQSPALEEYKTIASVISKVADTSNIAVTFTSPITNSMNQNVFGLYKDGNIYVDNTLDKELLQDTLLHEAIHATISNIILNPKTTEQQLLKQRLFNVHDLFVDNLSIDLLKKYFKGIPEDKLLTLKSVFKKGDAVSLDEFISYSLSSKNFREVLKDQGLWEKVKLLLKNLLKTVGITIKDDVNLNQNLLSLTEKYIFASLDEYMSKVKITNEPFIKQTKVQQTETTDLFRLAIENKSTNQIFLQALGLDSFEELSEEEYQLILNELIKKDPTKNTSEFLGELKNKLCKHG